jgi:fucose permease
MNHRRLFVCSCIALVTSAFTFSLHGDVMQNIGQAFNFTQEQNGAIGQAIFWGMAAAMLVGGFICDLIGMRSVMFLALASHLTGVLGIVFCKEILGGSLGTPSYFRWLWAWAFIMGSGNGWVEVGINPLVATLYPRDKTHYLNVLHAWWPGGLILGGLTAVFVMHHWLFKEPGRLLFDRLSLWQATLLIIVIPACVYGWMLIGSKFPPTERVSAGVTTGQMFRETLRPMFWLWAFCMLLTAATELGPQKWQNSVLESTTNMKQAGTLVLVYTAGLMFVLRNFAGPIAHRLSPIGMLTASAGFAAVGLFLLSCATNALTAFGYATLYGLGIAYFWPTMLGVASERFPKGGALILALMGTAGNISIGFALEKMGRIVDVYSVRSVEATDPALGRDIFKLNADGKPIALNEARVNALAPGSHDREIADQAKRVGFSMAFRWVSLLPLALVFIFGAIAISDRLRGGYQAVHIAPALAAPEPAALA